MIQLRILEYKLLIKSKWEPIDTPDLYRDVRYDEAKRRLVKLIFGWSSRSLGKGLRSEECLVGA